MTADEEALRTLLDEARRHLEVQIAFYRGLEGKAMDLVKVGGVVLALAASGFGVLARVEEPPSVPPFARAAILTGLVAVVASAAAAAFSSASARLGTGVRGFHSARDTPLTAEETYAFLLASYEDMLEENARNVERKSRSLDYGIF